MAETIQHYLENMLPELEDLEERGLISKAERASIVKKRTRFEYALKRRQPHKIDFLRYIEYEMNLDALIKKRRGRLEEKNAKFHKFSRGYMSGQRRIITIFERAVKRFHGDVALWLQYAEYARHNDSTRLLSRIFARLLQLHPAKPQLWIYVAAWEFEENGNIVAARALMQRGLRFNADSKELWLEYFRLELAHVEMLRRRRIVLGLDGNNTPANKETPKQHTKNDDKDEQEQDMIKFNDDEPASQAHQEMVKELEESQNKQRNNPYLEGAVAKVVYQCAIKAIPNDLEFRKQFLDVYSKFKGHEEGRAQIYASIETDFANNPAARSLLAERYISGVKPDTAAFVEGLGQCVKAYVAAIQDLNTAEMREYYVNFLTNLLKVSKEEHVCTFIKAALVKALSEAEAHQQVTPVMYVQWTRFAHKVQQDQHKALQVAQIGTDRYPTYPDLWLERLSLIPTENRLDECRKAVTACPGSIKIWEQMLDTCQTLWLNDLISREDVDQAYMDAILRTIGLSSNEIAADSADINTRLQLRYLEWTLKHQGIEGLRRLSKQLARALPVSKAFYDRCIELERSQPTSPNDQAARERITWLFDQSLSADMTCEDTWMAFIQWHLDAGRFGQAADVYNKAERVLGDKAGFAARYQAALNGERR